MAPNIDSVGREGLTPATWWKVDRNQEPRLTAGATPLVERCIRAHGWTEAFALQVLAGYERFLGFKHTFKDWEDVAFSPPVSIEKMWQLHVVDTAHYAKDCQLLFANMINHNPDGHLDKQAHYKRIENTKSVLHLKCRGEFDEQVWNFGGLDAPGRVSDSDEARLTMRDDEERGTKRPRSQEPTTNPPTVSPPMGRSRSVFAGSPAAESVVGVEQSVPPPQSAAVKPPTQRPGYADAVTYVMDVKRKVGDDIYKEFLQIMRKFKSQEVGLPFVIDRISRLFHGHNNLILGFNKFLPNGFSITLQDTGIERQDAKRAAREAREGQVAASDEEDGHGHRTFKVRDPVGTVTYYFRMKETTPMRRVFQTVADRRGENIFKMRFLLDGDRIGGDQTPRELELEDDDEIQIAFELV